MLMENIVHETILTQRETTVKTPAMQRIREWESKEQYIGNKRGSWKRELHNIIFFFLSFTTYNSMAFPTGLKSLGLSQP